ncbi:hypothetical protein CAPTEDRAFT_100603 [Capitella teleta]|uniref:Uncharacterized protein n=1 Tax=Capitella teleta TaxID=283909 RepID=R7U946_CAPTE|nr:hypothetical protein CAPTEDRAFT_100603 [Capitella teleta]|eukprot:ELU00217.1 hypothetical protein CAPTEDRAFT_100603 [Capitella teleta]
MWRLDDDSYLLAPIPFDIFQFMENHNIDYGYLSIGSEIESCVVGLWEAVEHYAEQNGASTEFYRKWKYPMYYFNNFEISRRSIWTSQEYRSYIDYIDHKGGIYFHRWGDAPIKSLGVTLTVQEKRTFCFRDVIQYHHSVYNLPPGFPHHNISEIH